MTAIETIALVATSRAVDALDAKVAEKALRVAKSVSPLWPLSCFVAVNPYLARTGLPLPEAALQLARRRRGRLAMDRSFYLAAYADRTLEHSHLARICREDATALATGTTATTLANAMSEKHGVAAPAFPTVASEASRLVGVDLESLLVERISGWASSYFDRGQAILASPFQDMPPFEAFCEETRVDRSLDAYGLGSFASAIAELPAEPVAAIVSCVRAMRIPEPMVEDYLEAALASVAGWAGFTHQLDWTAGNVGTPTSASVALLAVRCAWDFGLLAALGARFGQVEWEASLAHHAGHDQPLFVEQTSKDLMMQAAYELAIREKTIASLLASPGQRPKVRPKAQVVFCIDVRSEVFRRHLETADDGIETLGFAGFFGVSVEKDGAARCPVLLSPGMTLAIDGEESESTEGPFDAFRRSAVSCFTYVSALGAKYLFDLAKDSLSRSKPRERHHNQSFQTRAHLGTKTAAAVLPLTAEAKADIAEKALRGMSLLDDLGRLVVLLGHEGSSKNNPHAASLHCGACGGHSGRDNARAAVLVLGDPEVRAALVQRGIEIPIDTAFVAGVHDTTTDDVILFDEGEVPATHRSELRDLRTALERAKEACRRERAKRLGTEASLLDARAADWAEVRPELALAGCSAFIASARGTTRGRDFSGTAFLHTYDWRKDPGFATLNLVMTAPMVVASWINLQYFGSVVSPDIYGSGDKTVHNVVGTFGVLSGRTGDLRSGLPLQSVNDGTNMVHPPAKLAVYLQAPQEAITEVLRRNPNVKELFDNGWLALYALDDDMKPSHLWSLGGFTSCPSDPPHAKDKR